MTTIADSALIITSISSLIAALASAGAVISSLRNSRKIDVVRHATNGMKAELIKVTGEQKFAEGVTQGESNVRNGS